MNGDFYPTEPDEPPPDDLTGLDFYLIMAVVFVGLFILGMILIGMYFATHTLTIPAGACVAPICM